MWKLKDLKDLPEDEDSEKRQRETFERLDEMYIQAVFENFMEKEARRLYHERGVTMEEAKQLVRDEIDEEEAPEIIRGSLRRDG